jgi:two-component system, chemotaxis family, protein-glutamate methylesterase/glutaminase
MVFNRDPCVISQQGLDPLSPLLLCEHDGTASHSRVPLGDEFLLPAGLHRPWRGYRTSVVADQPGTDLVPFPVVALTGSAGALSAVAGLLAELPVHFGAAVVVLLHQGPEGPGHLDAVLSRSCRLTVRFSRRYEVLAPGHVLVVPGGCHMVVGADGHARLITSGAFPPNRPSADLLLTTMGVSLRERAVAVILSGGGRDGATGATVIHEFGGTVIAADPDSMEYPSMPRETIERYETVDLILGPAEIAIHLTDLAHART